MRARDMSKSLEAENWLLLHALLDSINLGGNRHDMLRTLKLLMDHVRLLNGGQTGILWPRSGLDCPF